MKKVICLSAATLALFFNGIYSAKAVEEKISDQDLKQLVCAYVEGMDDKYEALGEVESMTESMLNEHQYATLKQLSESDSKLENFCSDF